MRVRECHAPLQLGKNTLRVNVVFFGRVKSEGVYTTSTSLNRSRFHFDSHTTASKNDDKPPGCRVVRHSYSPIDAFCSGVKLAYFPLGLLLPFDAFLTASLVSLIAAGLTYVDRGPLGFGKAPEGWK